MKDASHERDESFYVELKLKYAFDVPLDKYKVIITDSGEFNCGMFTFFSVISLMPRPKYS